MSPRSRRFAPPARAARHIALEHDFGAHNYHPLPVVLSRGAGVHVWDVAGARYLDCLSAYSAVNQGHCHPRLVAALVEQAAKLTLASRAFHTDALGEYCEYVTAYFGYERVLPMNTGVEGGETAIKLSRRWGYDVKGVAPERATVVVARHNFWGRTIAAVSSSSDPSARRGFGPYAPGFVEVPYDDVGALEAALDGPGGEDVVAFMVEPVQGEVGGKRATATALPRRRLESRFLARSPPSRHSQAGVVVPADGYLARAAAACAARRVLLVADEVQTGLGRCGRRLASDHDGVRPDVVILGKALSGGMLPVSAVLASSEVMLTVAPGEHGSTYGGNPLACRVATAALEVLRDERLAENAAAMGARLRAGLRGVAARRAPRVAAVRGRGLLTALVIDDGRGRGRGAYADEGDAWRLCLAMAERGVLAKPTHGNIIRLAPPLVITAEQIDEVVDVIDRSLAALDGAAAL